MSKFKIVLADDHEIFREGLRSLVDKDQALEIVGEAQDGEELLIQLKKVKYKIYQKNLLTVVFQLLKKNLNLNIKQLTD